MLTAAELAALHGDGYMTIREASNYFGRPAQTIYRWIREGAVTTRHTSGGIYVYGPDVLEAHVDRARRLHKELSSG